jgi:quercetin dioxygenase-like cupin family protein
MEHMTAHSLNWNRSLAEHFTGSVWNTVLVEPDEEPTVIAVQFAPGARTDWHSHPGGQVLYVVSGAGLVQIRGGSRAEITPGDVIRAAPGEVHWHGARPDSPMMHLSITSGGPTEWEGKVADGEYA